MNLEEMSYKKIQNEAKKRGISYRGKKAELIDRIKKYDNMSSDAPAQKEELAERPDRVTALESKFERIEAMLESFVNNKTKIEAETPSNSTKANAAQPVEEVEEMNEITEAAPVDIGYTNSGMLLDDYLSSKGMSFKELETLIYNYQSPNGVNPGGDERIETLDDITAKVDKGIEGAKQIVESGKTSVKLKDIYIVDALQKEFGWTVTNNSGGVHTLTA